MYRVQFTPTAEKELKRIYYFDQKLYRRLCGVLDDLSRRPFEGKRLKGPLKDRYSYRVGDYRVIYLIQGKRLVVVVLDIGHRRDIYT